jgi:peptidoglycan/LPS O-acetylase OafA/YrhL
VRALAALWVAFHDRRYYVKGYYPPADGVTIFLVLSGLLITSLLLAECDVSGRTSIKAVYARRALRIFPAYYVFVRSSWGVNTLRHDDCYPSVGLAATFYGVTHLNAVKGHETGRSHTLGRLRWTGSSTCSNLCSSCFSCTAPSGR